MIQTVLQLIRMGIENRLRSKFGEGGLSLLTDIKKITQVAQLKKILQALSQISSAEELKKLIASYTHEKPTQQ